VIGADLNLAGLLQTLTRGERVREAAQKRLEGEAQRLADAIAEAAPVHDGSLRESVRVEPTDDPLRVRVVAGRDEPNLKTTAAGVTYDEAVMVEYGTANAPAQPYFWPTVERMRGSIKANIDADLNKEAS
jgi:hypothetical protein